MAITASMEARTGPDHVCLIQLPMSDSVPFYQRRHGSYCTKPTQIRSGWPCQCLVKCIWSVSKPVCTNHQARFLARRNRPTTSFPFQAWLQWSTCRRPSWYCQKPAWIWLSSGWMCQVLAKQIRPRSKPVCKNHPALFWSVRLSRSGLDANQIRHVYWDFYRAANPSLDFSVAKSDFTRSNYILSIAYIYGPPSQFAFAEMCARTDVRIGCRQSDIVHYKEICEKRLCSNYVTTHKN